MLLVYQQGLTRILAYNWKAVKHIFRYLKGTLDYKLTYTPDPNTSEIFTTFTDADHSGNPDNGRSTSGYVVKMGTGAISWSSKLQGIVALSTTEAEFVQMLLQVLARKSYG